MVDLQRGVQSYLIAKSSLEQDGYEQAPDTVRGARLNRGTPKASRSPRWRRQKNLEDQENFQGVSAIFFCKESGRLTFSFRAPPRRPSLTRAAGRLPANGQHSAALTGGGRTRQSGGSAGPTRSVERLRGEPFLEAASKLVQTWIPSSAYSFATHGRCAKRLVL